MSPIITFGPESQFLDRRGGKIAKHKIGPLSDGQGEALVVCCPEWVAGQIEAVAGVSQGKLSEAAARTYTHGFRFPGAVPDEVLRLVDMLTSALSIPAPEHVDFAVALDWYNQPNDEDEIVRTQAGYWIWTTKYATFPEYSNSRRSRRQMIAALRDFILNHPLFAEASAIVTAPGHKADGKSFGEELAREVAREVGIPYVESTAPGPREPQKVEQQDLTAMFSVEEPLVGTVIVLDDVFHTGGSASGAAAAARRAGADRVLSLAVARTIRK